MDLKLKNIIKYYEQIRDIIIIKKILLIRVLFFIDFFIVIIINYLCFI